MATLTRFKVVEEQADSGLTSSVPAPFPRSAVEQDRYLRQNNILPPPVAAALQLDHTTHNTAHRMSIHEELKPVEPVQQIIPSIAYVQTSCWMILKNLLSFPDSLQTHLPALGQPGSSSSGTLPSSTLSALVTHLRKQNDDYTMSEVVSHDNEAALFTELGIRVQKIADSSRIASIDADLARSLVSLLTHLHRILTLQPQTSSSSFPSLPLNSSPPETSSNAFDNLKRSLSELQVERLSQTSTPLHWIANRHVHDVECALLWSLIDSDLEDVLSICRQRSGELSLTHPPGLEQLPPEYEYTSDFQGEVLPQYEGPDLPITYDSKTLKPRYSHEQEFRPTGSAITGNEKMRLELEAVTLAIDRLYLIAPQLHNQRVELNASKLEEMERARSSGNVKGKQKQIEEDLDRMLELIGRASERKLVDQSVVLEGGLEARLQKAKRRDVEKHQAFVEQLIKHSDAGRLHDQDAVLSPPRYKDPDALLTLPEFMREYVPTNSIEADPRKILSFPEFIKEPVPFPANSIPPTPADTTATSNLRGRSLSASSLSWIFSSASKSPSPGAIDRKSSMKKKQKRPATSNGHSSGSSAGLDLYYIAEHHENLQHVMVFFNVTGVVAGQNLEAEVHSDVDDAERLTLTCGSRITCPVSLPARLVTGKKEVKVQRGHFELKLPTVSHPLPDGTDPHTGLFDATSLNESSPTSFICSSCSLPLVQSTRVREYKDLPSEHWDELVDAWMCHTDQKLHEMIMQRASNGFWPTLGQALVGGSYILFEQGSVMENNLCTMEGRKSREDWKTVKCICGAVVGRCRKPPGTDTAYSNVYRLVKYAIRPVSLTSEPSRVPLSAFIIEDMQEYVQAHATYRFVLYDEEEELPRILIWLFKPNIRIAYEVPTSYTLPKSGCVNAAKVLFKLLGPSVDLDSVVSKYPGFPQAEHLSYPWNVCHRLAALLRESNLAYPESMRMMTGLEVGFLQRA